MDKCQWLYYLGFKKTTSHVIQCLFRVQIIVSGIMIFCMICPVLYYPQMYSITKKKSMCFAERQRPELRSTGEKYYNIGKTLLPCGKMFSVEVMFRNITSRR